MVKVGELSYPRPKGDLDRLMILPPTLFTPHHLANHANFQPNKTSL